MSKTTSTDHGNKFKIHAEWIINFILFKIITIAHRDLDFIHYQLQKNDIEKIDICMQSAATIGSLVSKKEKEKFVVFARTAKKNTFSFPRLTVGWIAREQNMLKQIFTYRN